MANETNHILKIDSLRGIAILGVFLYHSQLTLYTGCDLKEYGNNNLLIISGLKSILINFSPIAFGWSGVQLFLLISGFLIHYGFLVKNKSINISTFYLRRFWRIYPPYLLLLLFLCFSKDGIGNYFQTKDGLINFWSHIFLIHNLRSKFFYHINPSFWSLALEVQLYLIYPLFLIIRKKYGIAKTFYFILFLSLFLVVIGILKEDSIAFFKSPTYLRSVLLYWFIWCAGAFLAEMFYNNQRLFSKYGFAIFLANFCLAIVSKLYLYTSYFTIHLITLSWLAFFEWYVLTKKIDVNNSIVKFMTVLGICSYSFYLIHFPYLGDLFGYFNLFGLSDKLLLLKIIPAFFVIFLLSYSYYLFIEQPSIQLGKRIMDKKS